MSVRALLVHAGRHQDKQQYIQQPLVTILTRGLTFLKCYDYHIYQLVSTEKLYILTKNFIYVLCFVWWILWVI